MRGNTITIEEEVNDIEAFNKRISEYFNSSAKLDESEKEMGTFFLNN